MTRDPSFHVDSGALEEIRQVLIGASLSASDNRVVDSGLALAEALGAKAHILHCVWPTSLGMSRPDFEALADREKAEMATLLEGFSQMRDPNVTSGVEVGTPYRTLLRIGRDIGADLIVVGAAERPGIRLGSTAEKLVRKASCPVLVVREPLTLPLRRVLAPVDLSVLSGDSFRCGLSFLEQLGHRSEVDVETLFVLGEAQQHLGDSFSVDQVDRFAAEELRRFVDEHAGPEVGAAFQQSVTVGEARREIVRIAEATHPDLILLGTHGRDGTERVLIGSVAERVIRKATSNVLVIPPATAFGAELADAIIEQTEPRWTVPRPTTESSVG